MKLALLVLAFIPALPAVTREHATPAAPQFVTAPRHPDSLALYDRAGNLVAFCDTNETALGECKIEDGYNLNDVMNAWLQAYEDK